MRSVAICLPRHSAWDFWHGEVPQLLILQGMAFHFLKKVSSVCFDLQYAAVGLVFGHIAVIS